MCSCSLELSNWKKTSAFFLTYEISFVIFIIVFGVIGYSIRNNKVGENSGDIVFIIF